ncbi:MAG: PAS domain S-box protein [Deltaproteobacteria bacterium]|nr:PAS domain S-box protein [Deltaproteobacteria bacterium]
MTAIFDESICIQLVEHSLDAAFLTMPDGTIIYANPSACQLFGYTLDEFRTLGRSGVVDPSDPKLGAALEKRRRTGRFCGVLNLCRKDGSWFPAVLSSAVYNDSGGEQRTSMFVRDLTEQEQREEALRVTNEDLRKALAEIKVLRGIIPICANCKKIRDDKGYWHQVETYISKNTDALFSHTLCCECIKKMYHDVGEENTNKERT